MTAARSGRVAAPAIERYAGRSPAMARAVAQVASVAALTSPVLIVGEPGTGKGWVAEAIHRRGRRPVDTFVRVDAASPVVEAIEQELFGREDGSRIVPGAIERADGGTLFVDEIGGLGEAAQLRLLRTLVDRRHERVGGATALRSDVRLVAATSLDLDAASRAGRFHAGLLGRLGAVRIRLPALRERPEDLPELVGRIVEELRASGRSRAAGVARGLIERLARHGWPGNLRELRLVLQETADRAGTARTLDARHLPDAWRLPEHPGQALALTVGMTVEDAERRLIEATLAQVGGDKPRAAAILDIGLRTLYRKLGRYGRDQRPAAAPPARAAAKPAARSGAKPRRPPRR